MTALVGAINSDFAVFNALPGAPPLIDIVPPRTTLAVGTPRFVSSTTFVTAATTFSLTAVDDRFFPGDGVGVGVKSTFISVDTAPFSIYSGTFSLSAEGLHVLHYFSVDLAGNTELTSSVTIAVDLTPPVSSLLIGTTAVAFSTATVFVSSGTVLSIAAVDPPSNGVASGVGSTFIAFSSSGFSVYTGTFTLAGSTGTRVVQFYSRDNVLNTEAVKSVTLALNATAPEAALLSPGTCDGGICRVIKGRVPVVGTARDAHLASYVLSAASGQNMIAGFNFVSSGTVSISSGVLGTWDATALAGWQTLRLTAANQTGNSAAVSVNVFVGDPAQLMILGNNDVFDMPHGVASDAAGHIYVADTNADRVAVYTATGTFVRAYNHLSRPRGVAVDAVGNVYVADTDADRILKLSATGQILLSVHRFEKPSGIALDHAGNIFVSDTDNGKILKLSPTGTTLLTIALPPIAAHERDDRDRDDHFDAPKPMGLALDAAGDIYAADASGRVLKFGATGQLLLTIPMTQAKDRKIISGRPFGVAVSTDGFCLLVSDQKFDRVLKFDNFGDQDLSFGLHGQAREDNLAAGIFLRKPTGLALAADGTLLVADRNNNRVERFGLPTGTPTLIVPPRGKDCDYLAHDVLDRDNGGNVSRRDHAGVTIPPGALPDDLKVTVSTMSPDSAAQSDFMARMSAKRNLRPVNSPVEFGPEGTQFAQPVTLVLPYNADLIAQEGLSEDTLKLHYWNKIRGDWEPLDSVVDKTARTVTAQSGHFSLYQVLGEPGAATTSPTTAPAVSNFGFKAIYVFPNPAVGTHGVTVRVQTGIADSIEVDVYDPSGRKVQSSTDFHMTAMDDNNGFGVQPTYEHVVDVTSFGSGVFHYVLTARKSGQSDVRKTGKIAVIK